MAIDDIVMARHGAPIGVKTTQRKMSLTLVQVSAEKWGVATKGSQGLLYHPIESVDVAVGKSNNLEYAAENKLRLASVQVGSEAYEAFHRKFPSIGDYVTLKEADSKGKPISDARRVTHPSKGLVFEVEGTNNRYEIAVYSVQKFDEGTLLVAKGALQKIQSESKEYA